MDINGIYTFTEIYKLEISKYGIRNPFLFQDCLK